MISFQRAKLAYFSNISKLFVRKVAFFMKNLSQTVFSQRKKELPPYPGSSIMNDVAQPLAPAGRMFIVPPDILMICRQSASPTPEPVFFVLKNGMKISCRTSSGIGFPLLEMRILKGVLGYL